VAVPCRRCEFHRLDEQTMSLGVNELRANILDEIARCHARLGESDAALEWFEKAMNRGYRDLENAQHDPDLKSLHDNAKFREPDRR